MTPAILVADGEQRSALAVVRSLGLAGFRVLTCSSRRKSLAGSSRYCQAETMLPDPLTDPDAFGAAIVDLCGRWGIGVLLPMTDASHLAVLPFREALGDVLLPAPPLETFLRLSDKLSLTRTATRLGLHVPLQVVIPSCEEVADIDVCRLRFPLVLKPASSVVKAGPRRMRLGVRHAATVEEMRVALEELPAEAYPVLVQERIRGPGVGIFLLRWDGRIVAVFAHRRIREKPPSGGVSVYRESIAADPELVRQAEALLAVHDWRGVAMVEFKVQRDTGRAYLMEANGRFWGSLQLAIDAGVDFPVLLVRTALGERLERVDRYRTGIRSRWWLGDLDHLIARLRGGDSDPSLAQGGVSRLRALGDFLVLWRPGDRGEILRLRDPVPFFRATMDWLSGAHA